MILKFSTPRETVNKIYCFVKGGYLFLLIYYHSKEQKDYYKWHLLYTLKKY